MPTCLCVCSDVTTNDTTANIIWFRIERSGPSPVGLSLFPTHSLMSSSVRMSLAQIESSQFSLAWLVSEGGAAAGPRAGRHGWHFQGVVQRLAFWRNKPQGLVGRLISPLRPPTKSLKLTALLDFTPPVELWCERRDFNVTNVVEPVQKIYFFFFFYLQRLHLLVQFLNN